MVPQSDFKFKFVKSFLLDLDHLGIFFIRFFKQVFRPRYEIIELINQAYVIGFKSLPLVTITGFIMGLVMTVQSRPTLAEFGAQSWLPAMVAISIIREIGPVITALIFAGKVGSGIGAELASMRVTEQIDAMEVSGHNPFKYLVVTRIIASTLMLPLLVIMSDGIALYGSFVGVNIKGDVGFYQFYYSILEKVAFSDIFPATIKTFLFGFSIGLISCYKGYYANKGTEGVGLAANASVVLGSLSVFVLDIVVVQITDILF